MSLQDKGLADSNPEAEGHYDILRPAPHLNH